MMGDSRDLAIGVAVTGMRGALVPGGAAPPPGPAPGGAPDGAPPLPGAPEALTVDGAHARARARHEMESVAGTVLASPEVERVAARVLATADLDRIVAAVLDHELTEKAIASALASPGLERLLIRVLESQLVDELTERVLRSPELERVVQYVATSPQVLDAVHQQTRSFADEMAAGVRRKAESADDAAERTVRGWLRRPRPQPT